MHILTRRSITETHARIAQLGWEPSYHDPAVRYPTRYRFPHKAKDPMKHIMREYLPMELEKDERVYGGLDAAVRADMPNKAHERWLEILKPFIVITNYAEVGAGRCMSMLMSAVPNNELRNGYHVQFVDEIRHTGMQMSLARWYAKNVPDPAGWNLGPKAFSGSVLTNPGLNMLSHFIVGDPIQCAFTLQVVAETAFTNIVFVALPDVAARNGDFTLPTTYLSVQSDEARHISNGYATLLTVLQDDHNAPLIERDLQQAFWINHAFIDIFAAVVLEYFSKDRSDPESYLDKWDRWVRDDWHRAYVMKLGKLGLDIPVDVFERARERLVAGVHHRHAILAFAGVAAVVLAVRSARRARLRVVREQVPGLVRRVRSVLGGVPPRHRSRRGVPAAQLHQHGATVLLDVPGVVRLRGRPAPSGRRRQRFGTAAHALLLLSRMPVDGRVQPRPVHRRSQLPRPLSRVGGLGRDPRARVRPRRRRDADRAAPPSRRAALDAHRHPRPQPAVHQPEHPGGAGARAALRRLEPSRPSMSPRVRFEPIGEEIDCAPEETVLDAAFRHGYNLVYGCREGQCSACKCFLLEGDVALRRYSTFALSDSERANGYSLMCRAMPEDDVVVELLHYDADGYRLAHAIRDRTGSAEAVEALTSDIVRVVLRASEEFDFTPGQYVDVWVPGDPGERRSFSMANLPGDGRVELLIKRYPGGKLSGMLGSEIVAGSSMQFTGPYGSLRIRDGERPVLMIAGGSGMAPILSLLRQLAAERCGRPVRFFYGARTDGDLFWLEEIASLGSRLGDFRFTPVVERFVHEVVDEYLGEGELSSPDVYMCGPPPMVEAAEAMLIDKHGLDEQRIFVDKFTTSASASIDGASGVALAAGSAGACGASESSERDFSWYAPAGRRASLYEDVTIDTQPSVHRHLSRGWPVSFEDGRGMWNDDSTALGCRDWFAFRDPGEQWERPYYQRGSATEQQIDAAMSSAGNEGLLADFTPEWVEFLQRISAGAGVRRARPVVRAGDDRPRLPVRFGGHLRVSPGGDEAALRPVDRPLRDGPREPSRAVPDRAGARHVPAGRAVAADAAVSGAARRDARLGRGAGRREPVFRARRRHPDPPRAGYPNRGGERRHGHARAGARGQPGVGVGAGVDGRAGAHGARRREVGRGQPGADRRLAGGVEPASRMRPRSRSCRSPSRSSMSSRRSPGPRPTRLRWWPRRGWVGMVGRRSRLVSGGRGSGRCGGRLSVARRPPPPSAPGGATYDFVGIVMAKSAEGDAVAAILGRRDGIEVIEQPAFWDIRAKDRLSIPYKEVSEQLGYEIDAYSIQHEMSTHYGRMITTDEALMLFSDPTEAMSYLMS